MRQSRHPRHRRRPAHRRLRLTLTVLAGAVLLVPIAMQTAAAATGGWLDRSTDHGASTYTRSLMDDPIVFPGQPGATHLHDFFCTAPDANSTYASIANGPTKCPNDTGSYWAPALYRKGVKIDPIEPSGEYVREQIYYRGDNVYATTITPFPADFRLIAGNSHAMSVADNPMLGHEIYWGCSDNSESGKPTAPINCASGIISLHYGFPNCWDGVQTHTNDTPHVVYPSSGKCPATNPIPLPRLILRFEYPVGTDSSGITLASGPTYTAHADFWNTWNQPTLEYLVDNCLNKGTDCGTNPTIPSSLSSPTASPTPTSSSTSSTTTTPPPASSSPATSSSPTPTCTSSSTNAKKPRHRCK